VRLLKRLLQRLLVLGVGIFSIWLIVFVVFETADRRLPWILALGITYGFAAYIILPRAIRWGLKILQRKRVPSYTITGDGLPGDPVNVALVGTLQQLRSAFASLGWSEADRLGLASSWGMIRAFIFNSPYPTARYPSRAGPLLARPLRSGSGSIRRFWQLRMGDTAFLGRPWLAGPAGARLRLIRAVAARLNGS
jgi:hypothetical protein